MNKHKCVLVIIIIFMLSIRARESSENQMFIKSFQNQFQELVPTTNLTPMQMHVVSVKTSSSLRIRREQPTFSLMINSLITH